MIRKNFRKLGLLAVPALALAALAVPQGATASASHPAVSRIANTEFDVENICANGGSGLCLQNNGLQFSIVANDNKGTVPDVNQEYGLIFVRAADHSTYPFSSSALNAMIASGRKVYEVENNIISNNGENCLWDNSDNRVEMHSCSTTNPLGLFVASGSGRFINVGASDSAGALEFLKSSGANSGDPTLTVENACPANCWSNVDH